MIFLAVGTQLPFDRLTRAVDDWCEKSGRGEEVFGQIGTVLEANYRPKHFSWESKIPPADFDARMKGADIIVGHAGMGTIISALYLAKPVVIMARRAALNEQRNDHQVATIKHFQGRPGIFAVQDDTELSDVLNDLSNDARSGGVERVSRFADEHLIGALRDFIHEPRT